MGVVENINGKQNVWRWCEERRHEGRKISEIDTEHIQKIERQALIILKQSKKKTYGKKEYTRGHGTRRIGKRKINREEEEDK